MQFSIVIGILAGLFAAESTIPASDTSITWPKLVGAAITQVIVLVAAWAVTAQTRAELSGNLTSSQVIARFISRQRLHRLVWLSAGVCVLLCFQWGSIIDQSALAEVPLAQQLWCLLPVFASLIGSWAIFYDAEIALDIRLKDASRWQFTWNQMRQFLLVPLLSVIFVVAWMDGLAHFAPRLLDYQAVLGVVPLLLLTLAFPIALKRIWPTHRLGEGPLRDTLQLRSRELEFAPRDILLWRTQSRFANAAVTGVLPPLRYVLLTDRLVEQLSVCEVEMIFMHEIAHTKCRHSLKLLLAFGGSFGAIAGLVALQREAGALGTSAVVTLTLIVMLAIACVFLCGRFARLFELQADLWVVKRIGTSERYLRAIASMTGGDPDRASWLHPSFHHRCEFLLKPLPEAARWLQLRMVLNLFSWLAWLTAVSLVAAMLTDLR